MYQKVSSLPNPLGLFAACIIAKALIDNNHDEYFSCEYGPLRRST